MTALKGACLCGAVRLEAEPGRAKAHACHCEMCRRWTGSAFFAVEVAPNALRLGAPAPVAVRRTSDWAERAWCADCGSHLFYRLALGPKAGWTYLSLGLLDDPGAVPFGGEIYIDSKPSCYALAGDHSRLTKAEFEAAIAAALDD